jgi:ketosteroid isomerase-like protein
MKIRLIALSVIMLALLVSCSSAASTDEADPASIVKAFYEAENADNLDAAMALISDDAVFSFPNYGPYNGKDEIRDWEQVAMQNGGEFELSNIQVDGDTVTFTASFLWMDSHIEHDYEVIVQGGKIKSITAR